MDAAKAKRLKVIEAGLSRFYDEGHTRWPKEQFRLLIAPDLDLDDPDLVAQLSAWETAGYVRVDGTDATYVTVLRPLR